MWPFKKIQTPEPEVKKPPQPITLSSDDDDITRAINILRISGIGINDTVYRQIVPWMARAIRSYQDLDREAGQKDTNG